MLRSAVCVTAVAGVCALAACGPARMGAAAIVGDHRVSTASLADEVASLQQLYRANKQRIQLQFPQSQVPQQVLTWLVRFAIRDRLAARNHIAVSRGETQRSLAAIAAQARQSGLSAPLADLAAGVGLPPDQLLSLGRYQAIQQAMLRRLDGGVLPKSAAAQQALSMKFGRAECRAAKSLRIRINPQYGRLDYRQLAVVPAPAALSAPQSPTPAPTQSPQLTPPC